MSKKKWNTPKVDKSTNVELESKPMVDDTVVSDITLEVKEDAVVSDTTLEVKEDIVVSDTTLEVKEDIVVSDTTLEVKDDIPRIEFSKETLQELLKNVKENHNLTFQGLFIYYLEDMISKLQ